MNSKFAYVQNLRLPHEMAHSIAVVKATEAAASLNYQTYLLHPRRTQTPGLMGVNIKNYYDLKHDFSLVEFWVPELWTWPSWFQKLYKSLRHLFMAWIFAIQAFFFIARHHINIIQTGEREILVITRLLSWYYRPQIIYDVHNDFADWYNLPLLKFSKSVINLTVANCDYTKNFLIKQGVPSNKIIVLPNGYEPRYFKFKPSVKQTRKQLSLPANRFIFGYIGRFLSLGHEKGIDTMLKAAAIIKSKVPITIVAVGGPTELAQKYRQQAQKLGLSSKEAIIIDQVEPKMVPLYIHAFDIASLVYPDTFHFRYKMSPMKAIEYLAANKPIIASDLPTLTSLLGQEASYVKPGDSNALVSLLLSFHQQKESLAHHPTLKVQQYTWQNRQKIIFSKLAQK